MQAAQNKKSEDIRQKTCEGCPLREVCHKAKGNRVIEVNHNLNKHKQKARENLTTEQGIKHRKQRPI